MLACLLLLLPGCRHDAGSSPARLRVVFWAGVEEQKIEQANVDAFMATHPGITVSLESIPDNYLEKLVTAFAAHRPPDVLLLDSVLIPRFLDGDVLLDLQPYIARDASFNPNQFFPKVWQIAVRPGGASVPAGDGGAGVLAGGQGSQAQGLAPPRVYALPKDFTPLVVYYNKRVFDAAGVPYPRDGWTWQDFRATAAALTSPGSTAGKVAARYGTSISSWVGSDIVWFWQAGGDVLSPDGKRASGHLDGADSIRAVEFFTGLVADGLSPDPTTQEALGGQAFMTGRIAMTISGHWAMPGFSAAVDESSGALSLSDVGVAGLPRDKVRASVIYESGWAVAKESRQPELAVELAKYLAGPEAQARRAGMGLAISADRSVAEKFAADDPRERAFLAEVPYGYAPWGTRISEWSTVESLLQEGIERVLLGRASAADSMRETARLIDDELNLH